MVFSELQPLPTWNPPEKGEKESRVKGMSAEKTCVWESQGGGAESPEEGLGAEHRQTRGG